MELNINKIFTHLFFFVIVVLVLCIGWFIAWKYTISDIPIVREICGLNGETSNKKKKID